MCGCLQNKAIPGFLAPRPTQRPAGFDYDVLNAEVLLNRATARNGRLTLPDGMSYRYLVLPPQTDAILSPRILKKVNELAESGVTVIGPRSLTGTVAGMREGSAEAVARADGLSPDIEVDVSNVLKSGSNELVVDVANLWPNRLIGDATLPKEQRMTVTNVSTYDTMTGNTWDCKKCAERKKSGKPAELLPSGLLGPVRVMTGQ